MKKYLSLLILLVSVLSCAEKEDTTPSLADTDRLESLLDKTIPSVVSFKEKHGTYILYNFDKTLDFAYQFEQSSNWEKAALTPITHDDAVAAMPLLEQHVFACYSDAYKDRFFPRKLLLVSDIASANELGLSQHVGGHHAAVANINSVTFGQMDKATLGRLLADEELLERACHEMHRALLADYLVKARGQYPVADEFIALSQQDYASLMDSRRRTAAQLVAEDEDFFYDRGFFFPEEDESTYFPSAETDIVDYLRHLIGMNEDEAELLFDKPLMASKMHLLAVGLQEMGVDVMQVNPNLEAFLTMEAVQPALLFAEDVVTDNPKATMQVTILRGSHTPLRLEAEMQGQVVQRIDLTPYDRMRFTVQVELDGLVKGANAITLKLYEEGRQKPVVLETAVSYATMDQVIGLNIKSSADQEEVYRRLKVSVGNGGDVDKEENPNLTTLAFEKHGWLDRYFMEQEAEYRYWKVYKEDDRVKTIMAYLQDGFNEDYTAPLYRHTGTYEFLYNDNGELTGLTYTDANQKTETLVKDVVYLGGRMVRYTYQDRIYEPAYATVDGVTARVDCLDAQMKGQLFGFDGTEDLNPYYMPELPAVIPGSISEVPLQLLYSKYLFKSLGQTWNGGWTRNLDDKTNAAEVTLDGITWTFRFKLK